MMRIGSIRMANARRADFDDAVSVNDLRELTKQPRLRVLQCSAPVRDAVWSRVNELRPPRALFLRMSHNQLRLVCRQKPTKYTYLYGETPGRFSAQIGVASEGGFAWVIFHSEVRGAIWGGSAPTVEEAKSAAREWLYQFARPEL